MFIIVDPLDCALEGPGCFSVTLELVPEESPSTEHNNVPSQSDLRGAIIEFIPLLTFDVVDAALCC